jgi:hypothetical protein
MSKHHPKTIVIAESKTLTQQTSRIVNEQPDDRHPGSFFRVPGLPVPGKTTWCSAK